MRTSLAIIAAATIGLGGAMFGSSPAAADPVTVTPAQLVYDGASANVELVQRRGPGFRGHRHTRRHFRGHHPRGYGHRHYRGRDRGAAAAAGILGFGLGAMAGQAMGQPRTHYQTHAGLPPQHVQWCQQRYRSYDVQSDTFLSYDGNRYHCNSPHVAR